MAEKESSILNARTMQRVERMLRENPDKVPEVLKLAYFRESGVNVQTEGDTENQSIEPILVENEVVPTEEGVVSELRRTLSEAALSPEVVNEAEQIVRESLEENNTFQKVELTPEEETRVSQFKIKADSKNQLPTDEEIAQFIRNLIEARGRSNVMEVIDNSSRELGAVNYDNSFDDVIDGEFFDTESEHGEPVWYEGMYTELTEATRGLKVWKDRNDHSKGKFPQDQIDADKQLIIAARKSLKDHGVYFDEKYMDNDDYWRRQVGQAKRLVVDGLPLIPGGMTKSEAEEIFKVLNVDVDKVKEEKVALRNKERQQGDTQTTPENDLEAAKKNVESIFQEIENPKHRLSELRELLKKHKSLDARAWIYEQIDEIDEKSKQIDLSEVERRYDYLQNSFNFTGNPKQRVEAARRWLENYQGKPGVSEGMVEEVAKLLIPETKKELETDLIDALTQYCLDSVFVRGSNSGPTIYNSLFNVNGWLFTERGLSLDEVEKRRESIKELVDKLGLDNWISIRNVVSEWDGLKKVDDITSGSLRASLFVPQFTERFFAGYSKDGSLEGPRMLLLPGETVEKDIQVEVSRTMKVLKNFFDSNEYWQYIGAPWERKVELYKRLGQNPYVGEVAFAMLTSNLILTESKGTSLDPFLLMVNGASKRTKAYGIDVTRSPEVRSFVQQYQASQLNAVDKALEKVGRGKELKTPNPDQIEVWLSENYPNKLIPTGLSSGGKEALENNNWLLWRVSENTFSSAERALSTNFDLNPNSWIDAANEGVVIKGRTIKPTADQIRRLLEKKRNWGAMSPQERLASPGLNLTGDEKLVLNEITRKVSAETKIATDTEVRIEQMKTALDLLIAIKDAVKPDSDLDKMSVVKAKCLVHWKTMMKQVGWVTSDDIIDNPDFCLNGASRQSVDEWTSSVTENVAAVFLFTHSIADFKNSRPLEMKVLAEKAELLLQMDVQRPKIQSYIWLGEFDGPPEPLMRNKRRFVQYVDELWDDCYDIIDRIQIRRVDPKTFPKWWSAGVYPPDALVESAKKSNNDIAAWGRRSKRWR